MRVAIFGSIALTMMTPLSLGAESVSGTYVEARTCQVYTGPCFANGEVGSAGKNAIMVWHFTNGAIGSVDVAGHSVAVIVKSSHTLGFHGLDDAKTKQAVVVVDSTTDATTSAALQEFAQEQTGLSADEVARVEKAEIAMDFDIRKLTASVEVSGIAHLQTRKARKGDCICSNESAYYPPLTKLEGFVPGVTIVGDVTARRLGSRWSIPDSRTAYLGTFDVDTSELQLVARLE